MNEFIPTRPFRFWCQKVLPLVYDDSLSYYELLCKVVDYLNNVIQDVNNLGENFKELNDAFNALKKYVEDYFENLDVQEEINNKLDEMVADGSLAAILQKLIYSPINVKYSGVEPDTGNDLTAQLQALFNSHPGEAFYFPAGTYIINGSISLNFPVELVLDDNAILTAGASDNIMFNVADTAFRMTGGQIQKGSLSLFESRTLTFGIRTSGLFFFTNCDKINIQGVTLNFNTTTNTFTFLNSRNVKISNSNFSKFLYGAIMFYNACKNVGVDNCNFSEGRRSTAQPYNYPIANGYLDYTVKTDMIDNYNVDNCRFDTCDWEGVDSHGGKNIRFSNLYMHNCNRFVTTYADRRPTLSDYDFCNVTVENCYLWNDPDYAGVQTDASIYCGSTYNRYFTNLTYRNIIMINPFCYNDALNNAYGAIYNNYNRNCVFESIRIIANKTYIIAPYAMYMTATKDIRIDGFEVIGFPAQTSSGLIYLQYVTGQANNIFIDTIGESYCAVYIGRPCMFRFNDNISGSITRAYYDLRPTHLMTEGEVIPYTFNPLAPSNQWATFQTTTHKGFGLSLSSTDTPVSKNCRVTSGNKEIYLGSELFFSIIGTSVLVSVGSNTLDTTIMDFREKYVTLKDTPTFSGSGTITINRFLRNNIGAAAE